MAKIGYEVEGSLKYGNVKTLFVDATEFNNKITAKWLKTKDVTHVYVSDHENSIDLRNDDTIETLAKAKILVTFEVTELKEWPPDYVSIFWNAGRATYEQMSTLQFLRIQDQVKLEHNRFVMAWTVNQTVETFAWEFEDDVEVKLP